MTRLIPYAGFDPSEVTELRAAQPYRARKSYRRREPSWWSEARRLEADGRTIEQISTELGQRARSVQRALDPDYRELLRREDAQRYRCAREAGFHQHKEIQHVR